MFKWTAFPQITNISNSAFAPSEAEICFGHICEILNFLFVGKRGKWGEGMTGGGKYSQPSLPFSFNNSFSLTKREKRTQQIPQLFPDFTCIHKFSSRSDQQPRKKMECGHNDKS